MSDNLPTNVQLDSNQNGSVSFATEVIATIAGLAATEVEGVASMFGGSTSIASILRGSQNAKNLTKGVRVELADGKLVVLVSIIVDYGSPIPEVSANIQENVKKAVETMSGLTVSNVDVHVQGLSFDKENRAAAEIEMQQRARLQQQQDQSAIGGERAPDPAKEDEIEAEDEGDYELILEDVEEDEEPEEEPSEQDAE